MGPLGELIELVGEEAARKWWDHWLVCYSTEVAYSKEDATLHLSGDDYSTILFNKIHADLFKAVKDHVRIESRDLFDGVMVVSGRLTILL